MKLTIGHWMILRSIIIIVVAIMYILVSENYLVDFGGGLSLILEAQYSN